MIKISKNRMKPKSISVSVYDIEHYLINQLPIAMACYIDKPLIKYAIMHPDSDISLIKEINKLINIYSDSLFADTIDRYDVIWEEE